MKELEESRETEFKLLFDKLPNQHREDLQFALDYEIEMWELHCVERTPEVWTRLYKWLKEMPPQEPANG